MPHVLFNNCYVGAFGTCDECDLSGSCICGAFWSSKNHYLALDRTDWGEGKLVCSTLDPVIKGLDVIALLCQLILVMVVLQAFRNQRGVINSSRVKWWQHLPMLVLSFLLLHVCFAFGFALQDLLRYDWTIGIHAVPSVLFFFRMFFLYMAEASNSLNSLKVSMSTYELSHGVAYIQAVARREKLVILAQALFFIVFGVVPLLGVVLASNGYTEMSTQEAILIATFGGDALLNAALVLRLQGSKTGMHKLFESVLETSEAEVRQELAFLARYQNDGSLASVPSTGYFITTAPETPSQTQAMSANASSCRLPTAPSCWLPTAPSCRLPTASGSRMSAVARQASCGHAHYLHSHLSVAEEREIDTAVARETGNDSFLSHKRERVKHLRNQIRKTRRSQAAYKWSTLKASLSAGILALTTAAFALTPYLWSATAYFVAIQSVWTCYFVLVLVLPFAMPASDSRNTFRANVWSLGSRAVAGQTPSSSPDPPRRVRRFSLSQSHGRFSRGDACNSPPSSTSPAQPVSTLPTNMGNSHSMPTPLPPASPGDAAQVELQSVLVESAPSSAPVSSTSVCEPALNTPHEAEQTPTPSMNEQTSTPSMGSGSEERTTPPRRPLNKLEC
mmetsp:Transcript_40015/g.87836  ORF Transcript_40015/g.87836 Transcript_40015/m.87836 type:complete len:618 (-) Transcript_40015:264-2117(-)